MKNSSGRMPALKSQIKTLFRLVKLHSHFDQILYAEGPLFNEHLHGLPGTVATARLYSILNMAFKGVFRIQHSRYATLGPVTAAHMQSRLRSEEHTSELQSRGHLVCRLLLEKKNNRE